MTIGLGAKVAKAPEHIDAYFFGLTILGMTLKGFEEFTCEILPLMLDFDIPGLVVNSRADDLNLVLPQAESVSDLGMAMLHTVTKTNWGT